MPGGYYIGGTDFKGGTDLRISRLCNPNHVGHASWHTCAYHKRNEHCDDPYTIIGTGKFTSDGYLETLLSCPQCGCGANGARDINDFEYHTFG